MAPKDIFLLSSTGHLTKEAELCYVGRTEEQGYVYCHSDSSCFTALPQRAQPANELNGPVLYQDLTAGVSRRTKTVNGGSRCPPPRTAGHCWHCPAAPGCNEV